MVASTPLVRIRNLKKVFPMGEQNVSALDGIDLDIPAGSFTVIMGPSGSGKSTLLYLVGGLDKPTEGEIWVDGVSLVQMDENALAKYRRRHAGFVFQSFNLAPALDALENVCLPLVFAEVPPVQRRKRATALLSQVGLSDRCHHYPRQLSGGQQQRVAVARALANAPQLILCDEPTGSLDSASGMGLMELLAGLCRGGHTLLAVTHDPRMQAFASQVVHLLDGRVVSEDVYVEKTCVAEPVTVE